MPTATPQKNKGYVNAVSLIELIKLSTKFVCTSKKSAYFSLYKIFTPLPTPNNLSAYLSKFILKSYTQNVFKWWL